MSSNISTAISNFVTSASQLFTTDGMETATAGPPVEAVVEDTGNDDIKYNVTISMA